MNESKEENQGLSKVLMVAAMLANAIQPPDDPLFGNVSTEKEGLKKWVKKLRLMAECLISECDG